MAIDWSQYNVDPEEQARRDALAAALGGKKMGRGEAGMRLAVADLPTSGFSPDEVAAKEAADATDRRLGRFQEAGGAKVAAAPVADDPRAQRVFALAKAGLSRDQIKSALAKFDSENLAANRPDPTADMGAMDTFFAGMGGRGMEMYRGAKQLASNIPALGIDRAALQKEIDDSAALDKPLKNTVSGALGGAATDIGVALLPGGAATKIARFAPGGAKVAVPLAGAIQGAATGLIEPNVGDETGAGNVARGMAGGVVGNVVGAGLGRLISPSRTADPVRNRLAKALQDADVPVSPAQQTGSPTLTAVETAIRSVPFLQNVGVAGSVEQKKAFTKAVAVLVGEDAEALTPEVMDRAIKKAGAQFEKVANAKPAPLDKDFIDEINAIAARSAEKQAQSGARVAPAQDLIEEALTRAMDTSRPMTGTAFLENSTRLRQKATAFGKGDNPDNQSAKVAQDIRQAYEDFADRTWSRTNPQQAALLQGRPVAPDLGDARTKWRILEDLQKTNVIDPATGFINPASLRAAFAGKSPGAIAAGENTPYTELVRASALLKTGGADSGTARNMALAKALSNPFALAAGGTVGGAYGYNHPGEAAGGLGTLALASALLNSSAGRKYLTNTVMKQNPRIEDLLSGIGMGAGNNISQRF